MPTRLVPGRCSVCDGNIHGLIDGNGNNNKRSTKIKALAHWLKSAPESNPEVRGLCKGCAHALIKELHSLHLSDVSDEHRRNLREIMRDEELWGDKDPYEHV